MEGSVEQFGLGQRQAEVVLARLLIATGLLVGMVCFWWIERPLTAFIRNATGAGSFRSRPAIP